jgi:hypothetical protein
MLAAADGMEKYFCEGDLYRDRNGWVVGSMFAPVERHVSTKNSATSLWGNFS